VVAPERELPLGTQGARGFGARRYWVVDVGTNSVKFRLAERAADGSWRKLVDRAEVTRLGEGLREAGALQPAPMERTIAAIAAMADEARRYGPRRSPPSDCRSASCGQQLGVRRAVRARSGVRVEVISGEEEARLSFLAATTGIGTRRRDRWSCSRPVAAARSSRSGTKSASTSSSASRSGRWASPSSSASTEPLTRPCSPRRSTRSPVDLASLDGRPTPAALVAMGGAVTNLASVKHALVDVRPRRSWTAASSASDDLERLIELFRTRSAEERREIVGLQPKRAEVILAGACIVRTVLGKLGRSRSR
jgi:exopolyphosphatase/guanosine-5'-triphosphate,3'-diphosphate pyrophosphatase